MAHFRVSQGSEADTRELLGVMEKNNVLTDTGLLISPSGKSVIFFAKSKQKTELVARSVFSPPSLSHD